MSLLAFLLFGLGNFFVLVRQLIPALSCLLLGCSLAYLSGNIKILGIMVLCGAWAFPSMFINNKTTLIGWRWWAVFIAAVATCMNLSLHEAAGFKNILYFDNVFISKESFPYSMYLNFDKVAMALALATGAQLCIHDKTPNITCLAQTFLILCVCIITLLLPCLYYGYLRLDIKIPSIWLEWAIHNLIFVCFTQEVLYRGFIQKQLQEKLITNRFSPLWAVFGSAIIFGLEHYRGGILYIILSTLAGLFYGYTYFKTDRISMAILIHFGFNLIHFIFFTYPAALPLK